MTSVATTDTKVESVEDFRLRARKWIRSNLAPVGDLVGVVFRDDDKDQAELAEFKRQRGIQKTLFDAGFAGINVPTAYGGAGLTPAHNRAFNEEITGFDYPSMLQIPGQTPVMPVILEFGTEEQKLRHIPPTLSGERAWVQFLSEPGGGSDAAGAISTAVPDGDHWIMNGSKIWSSGAWRADWAMTLVRTNWDVEKHRGLTVFLLPVRQPGIVINRIEMLNGSSHFCQDFFTDVQLEDANRIGEVDAGWSVGVRWMFYERSLHASPFVTWPTSGGSAGGGSSPASLIKIARAAGRINDPVARNRIGELIATSIVTPVTQKRVYDGIRAGYLSDQGAALVRLLRGYDGVRFATTAFDLAGQSGYAWGDGEQELGRTGVDFLGRQAGQMGGGTVEMSRNVVSERVLGMPRERSGDRDIAYRDVPKGPPAQ